MSRYFERGTRLQKCMSFSPSSWTTVWECHINELLVLLWLTNSSTRKCMNIISTRQIPLVFSSPRHHSELLIIKPPIHRHIVYTRSYVIFKQGRQHTRHNAKRFRIESSHFKTCISLFAVLVKKPFFSNSPQPSLPTPIIKDSSKFSNTVGVVSTWCDELALENLISLPSTSIKSV